MRRSALVVLIVSSLVILGSSNSEVLAQEGYQVPPPALAALVDAPLAPGVSISPDDSQILLMTRQTLPSIAELSQAELRLAGRRINPRNNGPTRGSYYTGLSLQPLTGGESTEISGLPYNPRISSVSWSPGGAYNRSLTPFGFQSEPRTFWEAPEIYFAMSPFMNADTVNEPLLMIHGIADNNSGTFPMQSERFYNALKGMGKTARLVMLPNESHGYRARESLMHMLWETNRWLEMFVKNAPPKEVSVDEPVGR